MTTNDALDEIEARWKDWPHHSVVARVEHVMAKDIRTLIEMVRARDKVLEAADMLSANAFTPAKIYRIDGLTRAVNYYNAAKATLDTPPAQEPTE